MLEPAPYRRDLAGGPMADAYWLRTSDDVRIRMAHMPATEPAGTVFIFPGRTEYCEKYGQDAEKLVDAGFHVVVVDWRGQGMADRLTANPMLGDVENFTDYQKDWASVAQAAHKLELPRPWHLLAHSMGGCIGLRALISGSDFASVVFTAPMWGIAMKPILRPVAWTLTFLGTALGLGTIKSPSTKIESYIATEPFRTNTLTRDPEMFAMMKKHIKEENRFGLGGPTLRWLGGALEECRSLSKLPSPSLPALCFLGSDEQIIDPRRIRQRMTGWSGGKLLLVDGAKHELLVETYPVRTQVLGAAISLYKGISNRVSKTG